MGSENTDGSDAILSYFNAREHDYMYAYEDDVGYLKITSGEADYYLMYDPYEGVLFSSEGETLENFPGVICDGGTLTLTNDFHFATGCGTGLLLVSDTTLVVPEGVTASIMSGDIPEEPTSAAIMCGPDCKLEIDGTLAAISRSSRGGSNGIICVNDNLSISGKGKLSAIGGDIINTPTQNAHSTGIRSLGDISISDTTVRAYSGYVSVQPGQESANSDQTMSIGMRAVGAIIADDSANVRAQSVGGEGNVAAYGCLANSVTANGSTFEACVPDDSSCELSAGLALERGGSLCAVGGGIIDGSSENFDAVETLGLYELDSPEESGPVTVTVDGDVSSVKLLGLDAAVKLRDEPAGSYVIKHINGKDYAVSFDKEQGTYVDEYDAATGLQFAAVPTPAVDFGLYYDAETGFRKNTKDGEALDPLPDGISADGNTLTLNNAAFKTTYETALTVGEGVTVKVPEESTAILKTVSAAKNKIADGIVLLGGNTLEVDGDLSIDVSSSDEENYAIRSEDLTISGSGEIETFGGSKILDTPAAIYASGDLIIEKGMFVATGRFKMDDSSETTLTINGDALVSVGDEDYSNVGMTVKKLLVEDSAFVNILEGTMTVLGDRENPGEIRLRDRGSVSIANHNGVALLGCYDGSEPEFSDGNTPIIVENDADMIVYGLPATCHVKATIGTNAVGGTMDADTYVIRYDDETFTYVMPDTGEEAKYVRFTKRDAVDYPLYFDGETGKLYTEYDYSTGAMSNPVDVPGALCEKNKLTLTSDFQFCTDYEDGLYLSEGSTLYVPEGESPMIYGAYSGLTLREDNNVGGSSGLYCFGDNTLNIDGELHVIAGGGTNTSSWGILNVNRDKALHIMGNGSLIAQGGNVNYDDTIVPAEAIRGDSCGIMSYGDLNISIAELFAIGGDSYICSVGMYADYPMTEPHTITISSGANVHARGGLCFGDLINVSDGCAANHIIVKDDSILTASASDAGESYGLMIFDWDSYGDGKIELSNGGSIDAAARESSYGSGITSRNTKPVIVKMDNSCAFTAEGAHIASIPELSGVTAVSDGKTVKYDSEKTSYVDADGNPVKKASFMSSTSNSSSGGRGGSGTSRYSVSTPSKTEHGSVKLSSTNAAKGSKVTITVQPDEGYTTGSVTVKDANGKEITVTDNGDETYSFTMPASKVTIDVEFVEEGTEAPGSGEDENRPSAKFTDVDPGQWYQNSVDYVLTNGLMKGTSDTTFEPDATMTRAMVVTVLYRLDGSPAAAQAGFADVPADAWYADAVAWGEANGVVSGYSPETFGPDDSITREQMAAILYRYAQYKGIDVSAQADLSKYSDADAVSDWADTALGWANAEGLITGMSDTELAPTATATRAQIATLLMRFCESIIK